MNKETQFHSKAKNIRQAIIYLKNHASKNLKLQLMYQKCQTAHNKNGNS